MTFRDLDEFLVVEPLILPIGGKDYSFPGEVSARSWLLLQKVSRQLRYDVSDEEVAITDVEETALKSEMFGEAEQEMARDGCTSAQMQAVFQTLLAYHLSDRDRDTAEAVWNSQGEAPGPNRKTRRAKSPAKSTRPRASRAGSTAQKARPAAMDSPGDTSLGSGA